MDKDLIGIFAGICTSASLLPQSIKSFKEKKVDVSFLMLLLLTAGNGLWIWYGTMLKDLPIIATNAFAFTMDLLLIFLKFWYDRKSN